MSQKIEKELTKMVWCVASYGRNWQSSDILQRFISCAQAVSAIGKIESINFYEQTEKKMLLVDNDDDAIAEFVEGFNNVTESVDCSLSGDKPFYWELGLSYIFNPGPEEGIGRLFLEFYYDLNRESSDRLWQAFCQMHSDDDCSYAFIHPYNEWISVRDKKRPLVNCATFQTVLWANFIGSDQMRFFDRDKLQVQEVQECSTPDTPWLRFRLLENINEITEKQRKKMTEKHRALVDKQFRQALVK
jgi:hypothetical protein